MNRKLWLLVGVVAVAALLLAAVPALAVAGDLHSDLQSYKFYDRDMDGMEESTDGIEGWWIGLYQGDVLLQSDLTDSEGYYHFYDIAPGIYQVREAVAGGCWMQTFPSAGYHTIVVLGDGHFFMCQTRFGNVCRKCIDGYTMGFWSNKNGQALLADSYVIPPYGVVTKAQIRAMAKDANAVDMRVMLRAQYIAHWLNVNVKDIDYSGRYIMFRGESVLYDDVLADFLAMDQSTKTKAELEYYKDFFDGLNNKTLFIAAFDEEMCDVPAWDPAIYPYPFPSLP